MDAERARAYLLKLPHVVETVQWGNNLVFWAGDKAIGGKMFALINLDGDGLVISFAAEAERAAELREQDGLVPAPYFARLGWVAAERWDALRGAAWEEVLRGAYEVVFGKLTRRIREVLAMPVKERERLIAARRKELAAKAARSKKLEA